MEIGTGEWLVIRLWRWDAERLVKDAEADHRQREALGDKDAAYSISVWAMQRGPQDTLEELIQKLCQHVSKHRKAKRAAFVAATDLTAAGFALEENPPPDHHHDVIIQDPDDSDEIERLERVFGSAEERGFPTCSPANL